MMGRAPGNLCQPLSRFQLRIELAALSLGAVVLPVWRKGVRKGADKLLNEGLVGLEATEQGVGLPAPVHAAVLLARAADAPNPLQGCVLFPKPRKYQVQCLEPHGNGSKHLVLRLVHPNSLHHSVFGPKIAIEVDFGIRHDCEIRLDHDGCEKID